VEEKIDMCPEFNEQEAIRRAQQGDSAALGALYEEHVDAIYRYMLYRTHDHQMAEDLTAEVFTNMLTSIERYEDRGLPFGAWLFRIARARIVDHWRRSKRRAEKEVAFSPEAEEFLVGDSPELRFEHEGLLQALQYLTEAEQEVILLRFAGGLSNREIAKVTDSNSSAVKSMTHRALKKLRKVLKRKQAFNRNLSRGADGKRK